MEVISTRRYEAGPPTDAHSGILVDPKKSIATVKEEEWETRKKKEITTTRQIETRVKRQVVLEDGEVVVDSGPLVTTNTTEDVEQQEHTTQERRTTGDDPKAVKWRDTNGGLVQKELNETVVRSREEIEELLETEDRQQLGDITDEAYLKAIRSNRGDLRVALAECSKELDGGPAGPRVVQHTTKSNKVVDTEKTREKKELKSDGGIVTETEKTVEHEEIKDDEVPNDPGASPKSDVSEETRKSASQRFAKTREEDIVDYVGSGGETLSREMRYVSETTEGERVGDWPPPPATMRTHRLHKYPGFPEPTATATASAAATAAAAAAASRKDAITKKPLDLEEEDEARKFETSKWLESHFGSDSRSSPSSQEAEEPPINATNTSFINVTMKSSRSPRERDYSSGNRHQRRPESSEYFHGVSEWAERWAIEKQRTSSPCDTAAIKGNGRTLDSRNPADYAPRLESTRGRKTEEQVQVQVQVQVQDGIGPPAPPLRRRRDAGRAKSPVQVPFEERTWEYRRRNQSEIQEEVHRTTPLPRSNSNSPDTEPVPVRIPPIHREKKFVKSSGQAKYKIGESFRKLVGKLRSVSAERKSSKRSGNGSTSQLTQTDDTPSYMQYNVIDRNIPLVSDEFDGESKQPQPQPQPRATSTPCTKISRRNPSNGSEPPPTTMIPVQRYYLGENPFAGSIYGRERGYKDSIGTGRRSAGNRPAKTAIRSMEAREYSTVETSSLGRRLSKSTSRLTGGEYEMEEQQRYRSTQTLPRKSRHVTTTTMPVTRRIPETRYGILRDQDGLPIGRRSSPSPSPSQSPSPSSCRRQYGSMINISIKNAVKQPPLRSPFLEERVIPVKPERTCKSSLTRSKSFTVDAEIGTGSRRTPHASNTQLNRLDETPPLKSPGILASINRSSSRDLFKQDRY